MKEKRKEHKNLLNNTRDILWPSTRSSKITICICTKEKYRYMEMVVNVIHEADNEAFCVASAVADEQ